MSIERKYSKSKAVANHVIWTANEVIPVPFHFGGLAADGAEFGILRVVGREMVCTGFRVDFQTPGRQRDVELAIGIYSGNDILADNSRLILSGSTLGDDKFVQPSIAMPASSIWKFKIEVDAGDLEDLPQGITATYYLHFANSPSNSREWTPNLPASGIGYWDVGGSFVVM